MTEWYVAGAAATTTMTAFMRLHKIQVTIDEELPPTKVHASRTRTLDMQHRVSSEQETVLTGIGTLGVWYGWLAQCLAY